MIILRSRNDKPEVLRKINQSALSKLSGIERKAISRYFNGKIPLSSIRIDKMLSIAKHTDTELEVLINAIDQVSKNKEKGMLQ